MILPYGVSSETIPLVKVKLFQKHISCLAFFHCSIRPMSFFKFFCRTFPNMYLRLNRRLLSNQGATNWTQLPASCWKTTKNLSFFRGMYLKGGTQAQHFSQWFFSSSGSQDVRCATIGLQVYSDRMINLYSSTLLLLPVRYIRVVALSGCSQLSTLWLPIRFWSISPMIPAPGVKLMSRSNVAMGKQSQEAQSKSGSVQKLLSHFHFCGAVSVCHR